jgi:hypothetical protein
MDPRIFKRTVTVPRTDRNHAEAFSRGERVKNIRRIGRGVIFEPVDSRRIAGTYAMDYSEFMASTVAVLQARA